MTYFEERFRNHNVHVILDQCLGAIESHELEQLDEEEIIAINRSEHVLKFTKTMLNRCDPDLVNQSMLDHLNNAITQVSNHWNQFIESRNWNNLTSPCDSLLAQTNQLTSKQRPIPRSYSSLLSSLRENTAKMLRQIREAKGQQDEEIEGFHTQLDSFNQTLQTHETQVEAQKSRVDNLITQQQEAFSNAQDVRTDKFTDFISEKTVDFQEMQEGLDEKFEVLYQKQIQSGQRKDKVLQTHCDHAREIVGIIGNIGVTGNYQKVANQEKTAADIFRWIANCCYSCSYNVVCGR